MITRTKTGDPIVTAEEAADFARVDDAEDHALFGALILAATEYAETVLGRDLRPHEYELLCDDFPSSTITVEKSGLDAVTEIARRVSGSFVAFAEATNWYTVPSLFKFEIELEDGISWPTDADERRQNVRIRFRTKAPEAMVSACRQGILKHVAAMYADRGDDEGARNEAGAGRFARTFAVNTARSSGAEELYVPFALVEV